MEKKPAKRLVASVLRSAAKTLDQYGWIQGDVGNTSVGFCAIGALRHVSKIVPYDVYRASLTSARMAGGKPTRVGIAAWNDSQYRKLGDVQKLFRKTARALEHGATYY